MKSKATKIIILLCASPAFIASKCAANKPAPPMVTGGPCHYEKYPGTITVTNLQREAADSNTAGPPETQQRWLTLDVEFKAATKGPAAHLITEVRVAANEAKQKGIKKGKQYQAYSMYQTSGTCNPGPYLAPISEWQ